MVEGPRLFARLCNAVSAGCEAYKFSRVYGEAVQEARKCGPAEDNPLWYYFQNHRQGRGIWKWEHYFAIYHRHLHKFAGKKVKLLEIGVYSGGSLGMWRSYFGEASHIYGVDIEQACKSYESDHVTIFVGDQADRKFWSTFKSKVQDLDVVIDDGGHAPEQQQITLEEMLPHLRPGGVYLCEDVHGCFNRFGAYAAGLVRALNRMDKIPVSGQQSKPSPFQSSIHSIHFYPYLVVIEKHSAPATRFVGTRRGTEWQPFVPGGVVFRND